ncbi:MAG: hypothetical protein RL385_2421 [Pseudomonadota bacterium]
MSALRSLWLAFGWCVALSLLVHGVGGSAHALAVPALSARVNDTAGILDASQQAILESKLKSHEEATGQQFVLLTVQSLAGDSLEDFSMRVVEAWKLGQKKEDNGLLMLVIPGDRKVRIEVGYGLEGAVPDAFASRIIRDVLGPAFRRGEFAEGVDKGFDLLMARARGEAVEPPKPKGSGFDWGMLVVILFWVVVFSLGMRPRRRGFGGGFIHFGSGGGGGGFGGGGGGGSGGGSFGGGGGGSFGGGGASGDW